MVLPRVLLRWRIDPTTIQDLPLNLVERVAMLRYGSMISVASIMRERCSLPQNRFQIIICVRVKIDQLETLRDLEVQTYGDTFWSLLLR